MSPPTNLDSWLGKYWDLSLTQEQYWERSRISKLQVAIINQDRVVHEIAHLIACEDRHVLCPYYGINEFVPSAGSKFKDFTARSEIEVIAIQALLEAYLIVKVRPWAQSAIHEMKYYSSSSVVAELGFLFDMAQKKWPIITCWDELQRKYLMWEAAGVNSHLRS